MAEGGEDPPGNEIYDGFPIPCEFCDCLFPSTKIIQHQSGCYREKKELSKPKRNETHVKEPLVGTEKSSEHRKKIAESNQDAVIKIQQHVSHDTFNLKRTDSGFVLKKKGKVEVEKKHEATEKDSGFVLKKNDKVGVEKKHEATEKNVAISEINIFPEQKEEKIQQSGIKNDGENFLRKESFSTKEEHSDAQKPNSNVHNEKSFAENDDDNDLSDDYNPENETVEHFMWKADNLSKIMHKSKEV